jgi:hypothetical protein
MYVRMDDIVYTSILQNVNDMYVRMHDVYIRQYVNTSIRKYLLT